MHTWELTLNKLDDLVSWRPENIRYEDFCLMFMTVGICNGLL